MKVIQAELRHAGGSMCTYIDYRPSLKEGMRITLRDHKDVWWDVIKLYPGSIVESDTLHTDWEVGGLG